ncbi:hypothetical protein, partial [Acholeplasma laidlawii]
AVYLLTKHFGREYSDKAYELKILEEKIKASKEEWTIDDIITTKNIKYKKMVSIQIFSGMNLLNILVS